MKFTNYVWELYKKSEKGKNELSMFSMSNIDKLSTKFDFELMEHYENENGKIDFFYPYKVMLKAFEKDSISDFSEARNLYEELVIDAIKEESEKKYNFFFNHIGAFSTALYHRFPKYFLPYYFTMDNYSDFLRMCENFGITLPTNPYRYSQEKRAWFYFEICEVLHQFRKKPNLDISLE